MMIYNEETLANLYRNTTWLGDCICLYNLSVKGHMWLNKGDRELLLCVYSNNKLSLTSLIKLIE